MLNFTLVTFCISCHPPPLPHTHPWTYQPPHDGVDDGGHNKEEANDDGDDDNENDNDDDENDDNYGDDDNDENNSDRDRNERWLLSASHAVSWFAS